MSSFRSIITAIITVSDTCSQNEAADKSGAVLLDLFGHSGYTISYRKIIPDDIQQIKDTLVFLADKTNTELVILTGGTGFTNRDLTPEATSQVVDKLTPGITIALISGSLQKTPFAMLSRLTSGIRKQTLIINFPGSAKACKECFEIISPVLPHAVSQLREDLGQVKEDHKGIQNSTNNEMNNRVQSLSLSDDVRPMSVDPVIDPIIAKSTGLKNQLSLNQPVCNRPRHSPFPMININQAMFTILKEINDQHLKQTRLDIEDPLLLNHVLGESIRAPRDQPWFRASLKDGYAVKSADGSGVRRLVSGKPLTAGVGFELPTVDSGFCARISTGAALPPGADTVIPVENTRLIKRSSNGEEISVEILVLARPGQDVRLPGTDAKAGDLLLPARSLLTPVHSGLLASTGSKFVSVYQKPVIGVLSTGDELLKPGTPCKSGCVYDSNSLLLLNLLREQHYQPVHLGQVPDRVEQLVESIEKAFQQVQVLITSGGVSMGERDLLKPLLISRFNATIHFGRVNMKPGKPLTFATCDYQGQKRWIFALPGNPVSAFVTCRLFVLPALQRLSGFQLSDELEQQLQGGLNEGGEQLEGKKDKQNDWLFRVHRTISVQLKQTASNNGGHECCEDSRPEFVRGQLKFGDSQPEVELIKGSQCSSRVLSLLDAEVLLYLDSKTPGIKRAILLR